MFVDVNLWSLLEEIAPKLVPGGSVSWIINVETIVKYAEASGLCFQKTAVDQTLSSGSVPPEWPWKVSSEAKYQTYRFTSV